MGPSDEGLDGVSVVVVVVSVVVVVVSVVVVVVLFVVDDVGVGANLWL